MSMIMNDGYKKALSAITKKQITVLMGAGGTGKSTLIKYIMSKLDGVLLLAPTGISALNIGAVTIHSFFKLPPKHLFENDLKRVTGTKYDLLRKTNLIIIDETSMVSSNVLDSIDSILKKTFNNDKSFGGIKVLLVGDCFQLPPIVKDIQFYNQFYDSEMFYDSDVIRNSISDDECNIVSLTEVYRQKNPLFVSLLNCIRIGKNLDVVIDALNNRIKITKDIPQGYIQITPYNSTADITNKKNLDNINANAKTYFGVVRDKFNEKNIPIAKTLILKVGCQVMLCKNMNDIGKVNGSVGIVTKLNEKSVMVMFDGEDISHEIEFTSWEEYGYTRNSKGEFKSDVIGTYTQIPLKLAWALTIHKVQSCTIEKLYIDMDKGAFAHGMLYVALSRAVNLESLLLSKKLTKSDVIIDQGIIDFYQKYCK